MKNNLNAAYKLVDEDGDKLEFEKYQELLGGLEIHYNWLKNNEPSNSIQTNEDDFNLLMRKNRNYFIINADEEEIVEREISKLEIITGHEVKVEEIF